MALPCSVLVYEEEISQLKEKLRRQDSELKDLHAMIWGESQDGRATWVPEEQQEHEFASEREVKDGDGGLSAVEERAGHHLDETVSVSSRHGSPDKKQASPADQVNMSDLSQKETPLLYHDEPNKVQQDWMINFNMVSSPPRPLRDDTMQREAEEIESSIRHLEGTLSVVSRLHFHAGEAVHRLATRTAMVHDEMQRQIREVLRCLGKVEGVMGDVMEEIERAHEASMVDVSVQTEPEAQQAFQESVETQHKFHLVDRNNLLSQSDNTEGDDEETKLEGKAESEQRIASTIGTLPTRNSFTSSVILCLLSSILLCSVCLSSLMQISEVSSPSSGLALQVSCPSDDIMFKEMFASDRYVLVEEAYYDR
ncbi:hypothetical protein GUITHDRAFT_137451 [Guillardia theta CCMP2712]|uniref:Uncharacterized protein n=1 Tax=Guillardia theta (strain CCMP2712) TaxID=905079 RepID=L1JHZ0_GUITC|nr:hypothetical protein GUITHDRAFT_137451 [Guillardia theta CCMP2712]EKX47710.1 hypothetical protein GUITHDRAFT_137451 [Guillardia theta CCMP2712]|eukprot:XP_005834690.1 hypothetical protein GUITHDRAFT_137451 [Guillardia theta CCMP2712]